MGIKISQYPVEAVALGNNDLLDVSVVISPGVWDSQKIKYSTLKAAILAATISGLTTNRYTKATSATTIGNALLSDDGTDVTVTSGSIKGLSGSYAVDLQNGAIKLGSSTIFDISQQWLKDSSNRIVIALTSRRCYDSLLALSVDWQARTLVAGATAKLTWSASNITVDADPTTALGIATKQYCDALVVGLWDDRGNYDASGNVYPSTGGSGAAGAILKGDIWTISVAGTLGGTVVSPGDTVRALVNTPGSTSSNWALSIHDYGYTPLSNTLNSANIFVGNGSNVAVGVSMTGDVTISNAGVTTVTAAIARLISPTFTGTPSAPTAAVNTNTTQLATTAFTVAEIAATLDDLDLYLTTAMRILTNN